MSETARVAILMGSQSDWSVMKRAADVLGELGIACNSKIISAHRKPGRLADFIDEAHGAGVEVFIAGAGMAAHLPGVVASQTNRPVLGVPIESGSLKGMDALLSIVQMPPGVPVGSLGLGAAGAKNAGLLAAQILALADPELAERLAKWRADAAAALPEDPEDE
ncbi:MAG: 5-(carboxyamino)imidazole ribonucleotide mutase [Proteobacteria bacterium]|nr:5-(carboxyamino)imidazole ribonucleotide mutase [Pseudomonadota bacterium]